LAVSVPTASATPQCSSSAWPHFQHSKRKELDIWQLFTQDSEATDAKLKKLKEILDASLGSSSDDDDEEEEKENGESDEEGESGSDAAGTEFTICIEHNYSSQTTLYLKGD
jgi:hypothetical protein